MAEKQQDIVSIAKELDEKRSALRESEAVAARVPALEGEIKRLQQSERESKDRERDRIRQAGALEQKLREHQAEIRSRDAQIAGLSEELAEVEDQTKALADAHAEAADLETCLNEALDREKVLEAEIARLKPHEEHTHQVARVFQRTKELT